jgi:hypothetical protein
MEGGSQKLSGCENGHKLMREENSLETISSEEKIQRKGEKEEKEGHKAKGMFYGEIGMLLESRPANIRILVHRSCG